MRSCTGVACRQISIHAPVKGATADFMQVVGTLIDFNPRSREGSDLAGTDSTFLNSNFNPRSREGSDQTLET